MLFDYSCNMLSLFTSYENDLASEVFKKLNSIEERLLGYPVKEDDNETRRFLPMDVWVPAIVGEKNSPEVMKIMDDVLLIKFPPNSSDKYDHKIVNRDKTATIISGTLYDKISGKCWKENEIFKVSPNDHIIPITKGEKCLVSVKLL